MQTQSQPHHPRTHEFAKFLAPYSESLGGFLGGAAGIFITHPLDTIRCRMQVTRGSANVTPSMIVRDIIRHRGLFGLYAGIVPPVFLRGLGFSMNRTAYAMTRKHTDNSIILGFMAGLATSFVDTPIFVLKNRVQCSNGAVNETLGAYWKFFKKILRREGVRGLYSGHVPNMLMESISYALFYMVYDPLTAWGYNKALAGAIAVWLCWPPIYPLDVLRTRSQVVRKSTRWSQKYFTFRFFCRDMYNQPFKRWFPGLGMTMVRAAPRYGVAMWVCETVKSSLED